MKFRDYIINEANVATGKQIETIFKKAQKAAGPYKGNFKHQLDHDKEYGVIELKLSNGKIAKKLGKELEQKFGKKINVSVRDMFVPGKDEWDVVVEY